ncbi:MAG: hypothetical protein PHE25_01105 [Candidatus Gracilibacteria bacterium]|nr:hypothetical protein [Candidatus Gracilibacteria bacterium]
MEIGQEVEYQTLSAQVGGDNEVQSMLKEGYEILKAVKKSGNEELYKKFQKEYDELKITIRESIKGDKKISVGERTRIKLELLDVIVLAESNGVIEKKGILSIIGDFGKRTNTQDVKEKTKKLRDKNINEYSFEEASSVLAYLNKRYLSGYNENTTVDKLVTFSHSTIGELDDRYEVRLFQDKLIEKIFGVGHKLYDNKGYLKGFNEEKGNYITTVSELENKIRTCTNFQSLNRMELTSYLYSLKGNNRLTADYLIKTFGKDKAKELLTFFSRQKNREDYNFLSHFSELGLIYDSIVEKVKETWQSLLNSITASKNPQEFSNNLKKTDKLSQEEKGQFLLEFQKNIKENNNNIKRIFLEPLISRGISKKEAEKMVNDLIKRVEPNLTVYGFWKVCVEIENFNKQNKLDIPPANFKEAVLSIIDGKQNKVRFEIANDTFILKDLKKYLENAKQSNDTNQISFLTKRVNEIQNRISHNRISSLELSSVSRISAGMTGNDIVQIGRSRREAENIYKEILKSVIERDEILRKNLEVLEKQKEELKKQEELQGEETEKQKKLDHRISETQTDQNTNIQTITYPSGGELEYRKIGGGEYIIKTGGSLGNLEVSGKEFAIISKSEKAKENLINFGQTLKDLNLDGLLKYREKIFQAISNKYTFQFSVGNDYLNPNEIMIFLKAILLSVGKNINSFTNFNDLKGGIIKINCVGIVGGKENVNNLGESLIEETFVNKFDPNRLNIFSQYTFQESLVGLFGKNS